MGRAVSRIAITITLVACGTSGDGSPTTAVDGGAPDVAQPPAPPPNPPPPEGADAGGACSGKTGAAGDRTVMLASGGMMRSFDLHVPAKYDPTKPAPLVFAFHGYTMNPSQMASATHLSTVSDQRGFVLVYPQGTNGGFNAGECCGQAVTDGVDDVGFTRDMIAAVTKDYCIDPKRIYETGFSNGGFMAYRFACEMSDVFAAVASVSGTLGIPPSSCNPKRAIPMMHVHGTSDLVVPYDGGGLGNNRSVALSVQTLRDRDMCPSSGDAGGGTVDYTKNDVSCTEWGPCSGATHVRLCTVSGGGHQWPGGETLPYGGSASPNLDASNAILDFFEAHVLP